MTNDLFAGTAEYYARYRVDYPPALYEAARRAFALDDRPQGTLLDLGTGTGFVALELARHFERVVGLDVDTEMLRFARIAAQERGVSNVEWLHLPAEELASLDGTPSGAPFRLVTAGNAFHWMDQPRVLDLLRTRLAPGGGIFLAGLPGFIPPYDDREGDALSAVILGVVRQYLGERRRAGSGTYAVPPKLFEEFLADSGYEVVEAGVERSTIEFDLDGIVGLLYSTSFANRQILGHQVEAFEADLRAALLAFDPSGRYQRELQADWVVGRPPATKTGA